MRNVIHTICQSIRLVWELLSPCQRGSLAVASTLMAIAAWLNARIPVCPGDLATNMAQSKKLGNSWGLVEAQPFLLTLALFFLCHEGIQVLRKFLVHRTTTQIEKQTSVKLIEHLLQLDLLLLSHETVGALHGRIRRSVEGLVRMIMLSFMDFFPAIFTALFAVAVAIQRNVVLGILMGAVVPVLLFIVARQIISQMGIRVELLRKKEEMDGTVVEQLTGIEYVRAANMHPHEVRRVEQIAETVRAKEMRHHIVMAWFDCGKALAEGGFFLATIAVAITMASKGVISVGEILTVAMLYGSILGPMREVHRIVDEAAESSLKVQALVGMLSEQKDRSFAQDTKDIPNIRSRMPVISCHNLILEYPTNGEQATTVLNGINADICYGETVGIVGRTGCGKSTWIKSLLRLLHPKAGTLLLDGIPIQGISRVGISNLFAYVGQARMALSLDLKLCC
jgi:ATP-binding cassette subfamily B protein